MTGTGPSTPLGLPTDLPVVLLPVRLETRFLTNTSGAVTQLLVRIYPDDVHVDSHETGLTDTDLAWGQHFWQQTFVAGGDPSKERAAWEQLVERFGPTRASYVAETLTPTNAPSPTATPQFPAVPRQAVEWSRASYTRVLPDRWIVRGWAAGRLIFTASGGPIPDPLAVGPSPLRGFSAEGLASDPDAGWLVDFAAAERAGMGLRVPNPLLDPQRPDTPLARLDRLVVLGVKTTIGGPDGARRVGELLAAHRYTSGLAFIPQGTPTNNTPAAPSGYDSAEPDYLAGPLATRAAPPFRAGDASNRDVTARALGVVDATFARLAQTAAPEQRDAGQMNTVLWPATWGYFLEQLLAGERTVPADSVRRAREHFAAYVRTRGPLPALRIGQQPYGLLPAISLGRWQPREGSPLDEPLSRVLKTLRSRWEAALGAVPRLPGSADPTGDLLALLSMAPGAVGHVAHRAQNVVLRTAPPGANAPRAGNRGIISLAQSLGITWTPRLARAVFTPASMATTLGLPRVQPGVTAGPSGPAGNAPPLPNYLSALATAPYADIRRNSVAGRQDTLLYVLLRHAALLEQVAAAGRVLRALGQPLPTDWSERELVGAAADTPWALLERTAPGLTPSAVGAYLDAVRSQFWAQLTSLQSQGRIVEYWAAQITSAPPAAAAELGPYATFIRGLHYLSTRPAATLDRHLAETLDLCSHRLDAWITSFATRRLEWLRQRVPSGAYLGGYGWVEDLRPGPVRQDVAAPPAGAPVPLTTTPGNQGFVHAPSLAHATTAAVLRSGYLARRASGDGAALAVNLTSERTRTALWLLDGVRQGQSLGALLGYRFERGLHENYPPALLLDRFIGTFRRIAPLQVPLPGAADSAGWQALEARPAADVADGLALLRRWKAPAGAPLSIPWGAGRLPAPATAEYDACRRELRRLEEAVDAIADLTIAEAVHQVAQGNPVRAGAALDAIAQGEAPPPDLEVIRTPRTGVGLTHRLAVLFAGRLDAPGWGTMGTLTLRALAEPYLNGWAARLLGPGAPGARCRVEYLDPAGGPPLAGRDITLTDLSLAPLDVVYLPEGAAPAQQSELEQRVIYYALRTAPENARAATAVRLSFAQDSRWPVGVPSFAAVLEVARTVRRLFAGARPIAPQDLALPDQIVSPAADADDPPPNEAPDSDQRPLRLAYRADTAVTQLRAGGADLLAAIPRDRTQTVQPEPVRSLLLALAGFGIPGAIPLVAVGDSPDIRATLQTQAESVSREIAARLGRIADLDREYRAVTAPTPARTRDFHLARLREVFGPDFRALPRFAAANAPALTQTFGASDTLQGGNPSAVVPWFQRIARVREGAARLDAALLYAEALGGPALSFKVGQLPFESGERWVGLDFSGPKPRGGRLSLVVQAPAGLSFSGPQAGLLVDEWVEVVPSPEETTGLTFHFDQPATRAPQAILLAVSPDARTSWDVETLEATVTETLDLAKLRTVDLTALSARAGQDVGLYLPALYLGYNPAGDTVATDLRPFAAPAD